MKPKHTPADVGVIVARFQVHKFTDAHTELIQAVRATHKRVLIFLGLSPVVGTRNNPLDFESRKQMILESFPDVTVLYIKDVNNDEIWSKKLDTQISDLLLPNQTVMLYGGRDSFISHYTGYYPTTELESNHHYSGTELRKDISSRTKASEDFRAGVIWATHNQFPRTITTVDAFVYDDKGRVLLVRKHNELAFRLIGGFSEPNSPNFETDVRREVNEESGVDVADPVYIGSYFIEDWRYRNEVDKIKTIFFACKYISGPIRIKDTAEIAEVRWFDATHITDDELMHKMVVDEHARMLRRFRRELLNILALNMTAVNETK